MGVTVAHVVQLHQLVQHLLSEIGSLDTAESYPDPT
jgi:hypothetical protein